MGGGIISRPIPLKRSVPMKENYQKAPGKKAPVSKKKKMAIPAAVFAVLILAGILIFILLGNAAAKKPTLTVETPQKISAGSSETITIDVSISALGDALYPAMSVSLGFDSSRLEFLGVAEGNVFILDDENAAGVAQKLPDWSYNVQHSNEIGKINIMYLDMTGGKYAFTKDLLADDDNVLLRLQFRLRGSARSGDVLDLIVEDAVFAASDETQSLAMTTDTLKTRDGKIVVGD